MRVKRAVRKTRFCSLTVPVGDDELLARYSQEDAELQKYKTANVVDHADCISLPLSPEKDSPRQAETTLWDRSRKPLCLLAAAERSATVVCPSRKRLIITAATSSRSGWPASMPFRWHQSSKAVWIFKSSTDPKLVSKKLRMSPVRTDDRAPIWVRQTLVQDPTVVHA